MSTGDPICSVCGNYKLQCTCSSILRAMLVRESVESKEEENSDIMERLKSSEVSYMEVKDEDFSCKYCISLKESYCRNPKVKTKVSPDGCCNLFVAFPENRVSPKDWKLK